MKKLLLISFITGVLTVVSTSMTSQSNKNTPQEESKIDKLLHFFQKNNKEKREAIKQKDTAVLNNVQTLNDLVDKLKPATKPKIKYRIKTVYVDSFSISAVDPLVPDTAMDIIDPKDYFPPEPCPPADTVIKLYRAKNFFQRTFPGVFKWKKPKGIIYN